ARQALGRVKATRIEPQVLDALLFRLVFTCYLFDRQIIDREYLKSLGIHGADHFRDILANKNRTAAKAEIYGLFGRLGRDFNGDIFSFDLDAESKWIKAEHLDIIDEFFHGTDLISGQRA